MAALSTDLCSPWIGFEEVHRLSKYAALTEDQVAPFLMPASELCYKLSGRAFSGECVLTDLRPCRWPPRDDRARPAPPGPGIPLRWGWCGCGGDPWTGMCSCTFGIDQLDLAPYVPVASIDEVRIDGAVLNPANYTVYDRRWLARIDGLTWPLVNRLDRDDTGLETWAIDLHYGAKPPEDAQLACAMLAGELAIAANPGTGTCTLPDRIQSVTRQGVTYLIADPMEYLAAGRTGIYLIDLWLRATNPGGQTRKAVLSYPGQPGLPGRMRQP